MPYGAAAPSARIRVQAWLPYLEREAVVHSYISTANVTARTLLRKPVATARAELELRRIVRSAPHDVLVHREVSPLSDGRIETALVAGAAFSVYDVDDALQWDWGRRRHLRRLIPKAPKTSRVVTAVNRVIAGNAVLAEWASRWADEVVVIPSCVQPGEYRSKETYSLSDPPRLGWVGSPTTEVQLRALENPLLEVHRRTGARLTVVSAGNRSLGPLDVIIDRLEWTEQLANATLAEWDVGLMPLRNALYQRGKCGYKLLQYGAARLPSVGSPVGVNEDILASTGAPAPRTDSEWVDALLEVLGWSDEARRVLGARARKLVEERFSYARWAETWVRAVTE